MKIQTITLYRQRLNLHDATFTLIEHEDAIVATVYKITLPNGTSLILKICLLPRHYDRELYFLTFLAGKLPVPRIISHVPPDGNMSGAILMECFPGDVLKKAELTDSLAFHMGSLLAQIHLNSTPGYGDLTSHEPLSSNACEPFRAKFLENLAECSSHLSPELGKQCEEYLQGNLSLLDSVDGPCMVHWDFRPGNIMAYNGMVEGVIDWSSSKSDFAQEDFCAMEHEGWASDPNIKESFFAGYASIRPVPDYTKIMPLLRLKKALASIGLTIRTNSWATKNAQFYERNRQYIESFFKNS